MAGIEDNLRRVPPQSLEAEESVLGGILLDNAAIDRVIELIQPDDFYRGSHKKLYRAMLELSERNEPVDLITLSETLRTRGDLADIGGSAYLAALTERVPTAANIVHYAKIVRERAILRQLITASTEIATRGYDAPGNVNELLDRAEQLIFGITERQVRLSFSRIAEVLVGSLKTIERLYEQKQSVTGVSTGYADLDALTSGLQPSDLIIVAGRPSMGKCLTADAEIVLDDGSVVTIEEIVRRRSARLLTLTDRWRFAAAEPSAFVDDGVKPVFEVTTRLGRRIRTTLAHPFLTIDGWKPLGEIAAGDHVAVPRALPVFGRQSIGEARAKLLGYLLGDGSLSGSACPRSTDGNTALDVSHAPQPNGLPEELRVSAKDRLIPWLDELGLWGATAHEKLVPDVVFTLPRSETALFLNRLFATDGWATVLTSGQAQLGYATASERLARQVQHLLLRFGVIAALCERRVLYRGVRRRAFLLNVTDAESIRTFADEIGIFGKEAALARVRAALAKRRYHTNRDLVPAGVWRRIESAKGGTSWRAVAERIGLPTHGMNLHVGSRALSRRRLTAIAAAVGDANLADLATSDVYWDEIVSIVPAGGQQVYDLTIPGTHNFVANDVCVHNTAFCLNIAENAALSADTGVAVFSLEMSKEQLAMRMLCSQARVDLARVRTGHLSEREFPKLAMAAGRLADAPIYIDDTPALSVLELRAKARRLKRDPAAKLGLVVVDYIQLMRSSEGKDSREQEISEISRSLKALAKELQVPVVALSQLNRQVENRHPPIPRLADLRECVTGDTLVVLADGRRVPIAELVGTTPRVLALSDGRIVEAESDKVWRVGKRPVFRVTLASGRALTATARHRVLCGTGWRRVDEMGIGSRVACAVKTGERRWIRPSLESQGSSLALLAGSMQDDVFWDRVVGIEPAGEADVYDLTVPGPACWLADGIVSHNSGAIEQDADVIMFLYREEYYVEDSDKKGVAEVILSKQRNGPIGNVELTFLKEFTRFENREVAPEEAMESGHPGGPGPL